VSAGPRTKGRGAKDPATGGRDTAGRDTAGRDTAGRDTAGRDTADRDTGGRDTGGRAVRAREPGRPASRAEATGRASARHRIGIRELRQHASVYVDLAEKGYTVDITNRGRLVAQLIPVREPGSPLERLIAAGIIEPAEEPGGVGDIEPYPAPAARQTATGASAVGSSTARPSAAGEPVGWGRPEDRR
jgi:antitoxin (DNA-binding transcriptional repressor) of toxin-antitoxin stability system